MITFIDRVTALFFSFTGTCGYSSGAGSENSQAQSKPANAASSRGTSSVGAHPSRKKVSAVSTNRALASSFAISWAARSAQRRSCSRWGAMAVRSALTRPSSKSSRDI